MADNVIVKDGNAVNRSISAREKSTLNVWSQRYLAQYLSSPDEVDVSLTTPFPVRERDVLTWGIVVTASANAVRIQNGVSTLKAVRGFNAGLSPMHIKLHDATTNPPVAGTTAVAYRVSVQAGMRFDVELAGNGKAFANGLGLTTVTGAADNSSVVLTSDYVGSTIEVEYV